MLIGDDLLLCVLPVLLEVSGDATIDFCKFSIDLLFEVIEDIRKHFLVLTSHDIHNELMGILWVILHNLVLVLIGLNTSQETFSLSDALLFQLLVELGYFNSDILEQLFTELTHSSNRLGYNCNELISGDLKRVLQFDFDIEKFTIEDINH